MSKYVIECPKCGTLVEGKKGIFARKKLECSCGHAINVHTDKLTTRDCPHCGNTVIYDQTKGYKALCPVCHQQLVTQGSMSANVELTCPSCSCMLNVDKNAVTYTCPLCNAEINVQQRIATVNVKNKGILSLIKYDGGNDVFVWKHPVEDFNAGSQLIVHESQEAVFFKDGQAFDLFGAGRYTLATQNLPVLQELYKLPINTDTIFHSEVYFINMTTQMGIKWGTNSKVRLFDPGSGLHIELGACGSFNMRVKDSRKLLIKVVGTTSEFTQSNMNSNDIYSTASMIGNFKYLVMNKVKSNLARVIKQQQISILEIDEHMDEISQLLCNEINVSLEDYGLFMPEFFITSFLLPDDDPDFVRIRKQYAEKTIKIRNEDILKAEAEAAQKRKMIQAQTEAQLKVVSAQGDAEAIKIKAAAEAEAYKAQAFAEAEEMRAKGYTYQQETSRQVGLEAMKNGITGGGNGGGSAVSGLGEIAGLSVSLGAMGGIMNMTKDALTPVMSTSTSIGAGAGKSVAEIVADSKETWNCSCGQMSITSKCCPECGAKKPEPQRGWDCSCGEKGIISGYCPECGTKKPEAVISWDCSCGEKGINTNFCPRCGARKPKNSKQSAIPIGRTCPNCGKNDVTSPFCPICGTKQ